MYKERWLSPNNHIDLTLNCGHKSSVTLATNGINVEFRLQSFYYGQNVNTLLIFRNQLYETLHIYIHIIYSTRMVYVWFTLHHTVYYEREKIKTEK